jgi:hypothetical protein
MPACAPTAVKSVSTWYQGVPATETFSFSPHADLAAGKFTKYYYKWTTTTALAGSNYTVTTSDTCDWTSGNKAFTPSNSKSNWLHVRPANSDTDLGPPTDLGPFYFVNTNRLLKHGKFFDDEGNLIEMGPKSP